MNYSGVALNSTVSRSNWNLEMLVFAEGGKPEYPEKNPQSRDENQQQTQPTYCMTTETRATLVGGECSHHCTIPAPSGIGITFLMKVKIKIFQPQKAKCLAKSWLCIETKQNKQPNTQKIWTLRFDAFCVMPHRRGKKVVQMPRGRGSKTFYFLRFST